MVLLYERAGRLTTLFGGFRPGQTIKFAPMPESIVRPCPPPIRPRRGSGPIAPYVERARVRGSDAEEHTVLQRKREHASLTIGPHYMRPRQRANSRALLNPF